MIMNADVEFFILHRSIIHANGMIEIPCIKKCFTKHTWELMPLHEKIQLSRKMWNAIKEQKEIENGERSRQVGFSSKYFIQQFKDKL